MNLTKEYIDKALADEQSWLTGEKGYKFQEFAASPFNIENERWIVIHSEQALERTKKTINKAVEKESEAIKKELKKLQARTFTCESDAKKELKKTSKKWKYHQLSSEQITSNMKYDKRGRPTEESSKNYEWRINATAQANQTAIDQVINRGACFVLTSNITELTKQEVLEGYKGQDKTEKGFAFLKSPHFFTSSLFLKKSEKIDGLLMIMVLSLLVYSIAQRRLRSKLFASKLTVPNQINKEIQNPTMRWIFQLFEGIDIVTLEINGVIIKTISGLNELRQKIINLLGESVQQIYKNPNCSTWG